MKWRTSGELHGGGIGRGGGHRAGRWLPLEDGLGRYALPQRRLLRAVHSHAEAFGRFQQAVAVAMACMGMPEGHSLWQAVGLACIPVQGWHAAIAAEHSLAQRAALLECPAL